MANHLKPLFDKSAKPTEDRNGKIECVGLIREPAGFKVVTVLADPSQVVKESTPDVWVVTRGAWKAASVALWRKLGLA